MAMREQNKLSWSTLRVQKQPDYSVGVPLQDIDERLQKYSDGWGLVLDPPFKGVHSWTILQQTAFIEDLLTGGFGSANILFNCPNWLTPKCRGPIVLVDGAQRLKAIRAFLGGQIKIFQHYTYDDFEPMEALRFNAFFHINNLATEREVIDWYISLNKGYIVHDPLELEHALKQYTLNPTKEVIR